MEKLNFKMNKIVQISFNIQKYNKYQLMGKHQSLFHINKKMRWRKIKLKDS